MPRILVIDDDEQVRTLVRDALASVGYEVVLAADGREGLAHQRARPAELVITDIFMPEQDGIETVIELRRSFPQTKIIAISGGGTLGALEYLTTAEEFGAIRSIAKPFDCEAMVALVRELAGPAPGAAPA